MGTLGIVSRRWSTYGSLTTPDPVALHEALDRLAREGVTHAALEASSHGLDQRRLDGIRIAAAGFTNLGRDHMDYHPDVEALSRREAAAVHRHPAGGRRRGGGHGRGAAAKTSRRRRRQRGVAADAGRPERPRDPHRRTSRRSASSSGSRSRPSASRARCVLPLAGAFQASNALVAAGSRHRRRRRRGRRLRRAGAAPRRARPARAGRPQGERRARSSSTTPTSPRRIGERARRRSVR